MWHNGQACVKIEGAWRRVSMTERGEEGERVMRCKWSQSNCSLDSPSYFLYTLSFYMSLETVSSIRRNAFVHSWIMALDNSIQLVYLWSIECFHLLAQVQLVISSEWSGMKILLYVEDNVLYDHPDMYLHVFRQYFNSLSPVDYYHLWAKWSFLFNCN